MMKTTFVCRLLLTGLFAAATRASDPARTAEPIPTGGYTYVIVHGATGGGWDWKDVARLLSAKGHVVYRPTLTGLGDRCHLATTDVNLTTHVNDIVNVILFEDLHDVVLVGHSYAGMVITGVMDRIPERLRHVIFVDASTPNDGQSFEDLRAGRKLGYQVIDGMAVFPWVEKPGTPPCYVRQPAKTLSEKVSYRNPAAKRLDVTVIDCRLPTDPPKKQAARLEQEKRLHDPRGWTIRTLESDHMANRSHPREIADLLLAAPADRNTPASH